jgi:uncharacterized protein (DUF1499 family)
MTAFGDAPARCIACLLQVLLWSVAVDCYYLPVKGRAPGLRLYSSMFQQMREKLLPAPRRIEKTEVDLMLDFVDFKPWRAPKVRNLRVEFKPWSESWREKYRKEEDDQIIFYTNPENKNNFDSTRLNEAWCWPWMWTKTKAERLAWIYKHFLESAETLSAQEHIEMDCYLSEFDMPVRWGLVRVKEMDVLNFISLWLAFFTDFHGYRPSDLGLRPDGSVKTCPVQFHNCISSSQNVGDSEHYVQPLKWSRSKSPDQAYEEIKSAYFNYPKRGLKWTNGWIDRGGWKPQQFSGPYFHAQADSLAFRWTDDIEMVLDFEKREVYICMYLCMYVCMYVHMYISLCI